MCRRWFISCLHMLLINKVLSQEITVVAVEGQDALLPCSLSVDAVKSEDINVYWRYEGTKKVYNILKNVPTEEDQDQAYINRTQSFPEEYKKGNFSIKLSSVKSSDQGKYSCMPRFPGGTQYIHLQVKAPQPTPKPTPKPTLKPSPKSKNNSAESRPVIVSSLIFTVLLGFSHILL